MSAKWGRTTVVAAVLGLVVGLAVAGAPGLWTGPAPVAAGSAPGANCAQTAEGFPPLIDMGTAMRYHGYAGGLYPNGSNKPPPAYLLAGIAHAHQIRPLNASGGPDPNGRTVLLSIGMSNTTMEFSAFRSTANADATKNPQLTIVDGAESGQDAEIIKNPSAAYWTFVDQQITAAGVTAAQVQAIWLKEAIANESEAFPTDSTHLQADLEAIMGILDSRFPHLQILYLAGRTYAGYATSALNPEPYAYESGFAVKWLIEAHIAQGTGPWVGWGPYIWTDGLKGRSDGLTWTCADVQSDGTHPSASGVQKIVSLLLPFFKTDATARDWFTLRVNQ